MFQEALSLYYGVRKWTSDGVPTPEALIECGLEDYVKYIPED